MKKYTPPKIPSTYCTKLIPLGDGTYKHCSGRITSKYKKYKGKARQRIRICKVCGKIHEILTIDDMAIR